MYTSLNVRNVLVSDVKRFALDETRKNASLYYGWYNFSIDGKFIYGSHRDVVNGFIKSLNVSTGDEIELSFKRKTSTTVFFEKTFDVIEIELYNNYFPAMVSSMFEVENVAITGRCNLPFVLTSDGSIKAGFPTRNGLNSYVSNFNTLYGTGLRFNGITHHIESDFDGQPENWKVKAVVDEVSSIPVDQSIEVVDTSEYALTPSGSSIEIVYNYNIAVEAHNNPGIGTNLIKSITLMSSINLATYSSSDTWTTNATQWCGSKSPIFQFHI